MNTNLTKVGYKLINQGPVLLSRSLWKYYYAVERSPQRFIKHTSLYHRGTISKYTS